ncbi:hypothetical protein TrVE_jg14080 [Triparma verrucosa]|uniref:Dolichol kinase n=1 Tax=Triparma verrucosa TaxID=1606542 RepID=A0A9W7EZY6_9STRA|nr:hypothetical protein TrVE_jg14080 [Triparma verrucosa]
MTFSLGRGDVVAMTLVPSMSLILIAYILSRLLPVADPDVDTFEKIVDADADTSGTSTLTIVDEEIDGDTSGTLALAIEPGDVVGDYSQPWKDTFDVTFVLLMAVLLFALVVATLVTTPSLLVSGAFITALLVKFVAMTSCSLLGGVICRRFSTFDEDGYVVGSKNGWFRVNYTRKFQHFAAYMIPICFPNPPSISRLIPDLWSNFVTLFCFVILIKPLRTRYNLIMLQFISLDRPEDRPHTLKWIVMGNIIPGLTLIVLWRLVFRLTGNNENLCSIFVLITGIGDGLAEPVGIWLGRHKYKTFAMCSKRKYTRSLEGSTCVFMSGMIFPLLQYADFETRLQMWICSLLLAPLMTFAEATAPHTMDTPGLFLVGGSVILIVLSLTNE